MRNAVVRVRGGMLGGAGVVTLLWAAQVRPSARPDALFATAAHLSGPLRAEPGQFLRWRFLQRRLWHTALPFSLSAPVRGNALRITVKGLGGHSRRIRRLRPGTRVLATGPPGMAGATRAALLRAGVPAGRIHSECFSF
ncbi:hypothetical protein ACFVT6_34235 [Streptomyces sp. NPDC058049]|uniref:hypothetical protein n=1 Tax=Streptomyces sp. NPDC058049 TaxID=3346314 RepID=UPI0036F10C01